MLLFIVYTDERTNIHGESGQECMSVASEDLLRQVDQMARKRWRFTFSGFSAK